MKCPFCGNNDTKVLDTRSSDENTTIRRRRSCEQCQKRFTTYERVDTIPILVKKRNGTLVPYDRTKIQTGITRSMTKRPYTVSEIDKMVDEIENVIMKSMEKEISTNFIGELVMESLKAADEVAYVRFASVYREFKDITTFMNELQSLLKEKE